MSLDGLAIRALAEELHHTLVDGRIDKIQQPDNQSIVLTIRARGKNQRLFLSAHPQSAHMGLINATKTPLPTPPLFCMVLRKYLENAKIISIAQPGYERIIHITAEGYDELGELSTKVLIGEFMGKHSNLILVDPKSGQILDAVRRLNFEDNRYRQIMPGLKYIAPPPQEKTAIEGVNYEDFLAWFYENEDLKSEKVLLNHLAGFGPQSVRELLYRAEIASDSTAQSFGEYEYSQIWQQISAFKNIIMEHTWQPYLIKNEQITYAFAPFELQQFNNFTHIPYQSMSQLLEDFIGTKEQSVLLEQKRNELRHILNREIERCQRKLAIQQDTVAASADAEIYKRYGELLTANIYQIKQGEIAKVIDYYDENQPTIQIKMDPRFSPAQNAQNYFKRYNKAKSGAVKAQEQIVLTTDELNYLESVNSSIDTAEKMTDLVEIRSELESAGYVKAHFNHKNKGAKNAPSRQIMKIEKDGYEIMIGKNNLQNDYLTLKIAKLTDTWLHVKDIPGSHVIIRPPKAGQTIPKAVMDLAANFAAYFSKGRNSSLVAVDYTLRKYVRKPNGAKPGMVIYDNQKTIYITPDEDIVKQYQ